VCVVERSFVGPFGFTEGEVLVNFNHELILSVYIRTRSKTLKPRHDRVLEGSHESLQSLRSSAWQIVVSIFSYGFFLEVFFCVSKLRGA